MAPASYAEVLRAVVQKPGKLLSGITQLTRSHPHHPAHATPHDSTDKEIYHDSSTSSTSTELSPVIAYGRPVLQTLSSKEALLHTSISGDPPGSHMSAMTDERSSVDFPQFSQLPVELRLKVWSFALNAPRVVEVTATFNHRPAFYSDSIITKIPSLFHVNHEAREAAVKTFCIKRRETGFEYLKPQFLVNHISDTLFISQESLVVDVLESMGREERSKIRSLGVSQNWWCDVSVGQHVFERSIGPTLLTGLEELVVLAVPESEKGQTRRLSRRMWDKSFRSADEVDASWRSMSRVMEEEWKQEQWQSTMLYRDWMTTRRGIESRWKELCEEKGVARKLRIVRGVVDDEHRAGGSISFVQGGPFKRASRLKKLRQCQDVMTGRTIWVI